LGEEPFFLFHVHELNPGKGFALDPLREIEQAELPSFGVME
jgi:hypothetical protein